MLDLPDITHRHREAELMDDPALDEAEHRAALRGLRRVNQLSRTAAALWGPIHRLANTPGHGPVSVLDIATGSGDVPIALARRAARDNVKLLVAACDVSERAIAMAKDRAAAAGACVDFSCADAIRDPLPGDYDVVTCSLFMHHLDADDVVGLLYKMRAAARRMVLVSDLSRSRAGLTLAWLVTRLFSRSRVVRTDAVLSVRGAFTIEEFRALSDEAGLEGATIRPCWPYRFLVEWRRP
jgi:2-polyprenyl-3-methyl-5-hydroxy-6-metoxy-1,4-benzoquinol methylase